MTKVLEIATHHRTYESKMRANKMGIARLRKEKRGGRREAGMRMRMRMKAFMIA